MTRTKLLLELSGVIQAFEEESPGEFVSCSLQIWVAQPGAAGAAVGPIFAWDGERLAELPEPVEAHA